MTVSLLRRYRARTRTVTGYLGALARLRFSPTTSLVLRYHSVGTPDEVSGYVSPSIAVAPDVFDEHVRILVRRFDVIGLDEVLDRAESGRPRGARPGVVITFDDGYRDNLTAAVPILERHGATATFYVAAGCVAPEPALWTVRLRSMLTRAAALPTDPCPIPVVGVAGGDRHGTARALTRRLRGLTATQREKALAEIARWLRVDVGDDAGIMLTADEVRALADAGMTVGSHTMTHPLLTELPAEEAFEEIRRSREVLEAIVDGPVRHFSYPNPGSGLHADGAVRDMVARAGYRSASTSLPGLVGRDSDPLMLARYGSGSGRQQRALFRILDLPIGSTRRVPAGARSA